MAFVFGAIFPDLCTFTVFLIVKPAACILGAIAQGHCRPLFRYGCLPLILFILCVCRYFIYIILCMTFNFNLFFIFNFFLSGNCVLWGRVVFWISHWLSEGIQKFPGLKQVLQLFFCVNCKEYFDVSFQTF